MKPDTIKIIIHENREINLNAILSVSANSREELRPSDVDRVMTLACEIGVAESFRSWLLKSGIFQYETREEIEAWMPEVAELPLNPKPILKRYDPIQRFDQGGCGVGEMAECPDGEYVRYLDISGGEVRS